MAIAPETVYPAQTDTGDTGFPLGKARNVTVPGAGDGTPLEEQWVNDIWGFLQALLDADDVVPSGVPDEVGASQYLEALRQLTRRPCASYDVTGSPIDEEKFTLTLALESLDSGYTLVDDVVGLPEPLSHYLVSLSGTAVGDSTANPLLAQIDVGVSSPFSVFATRWSANPGDLFHFSATQLVRANLIGNGLSVVCKGLGGVTPVTMRLTVVRVAREDLADTTQAW